MEAFQVEICVGEIQICKGKSRESKENMRYCLGKMTLENSEDGDSCVQNEQSPFFKESK